MSKPDYSVNFPKTDKHGDTHWKQIGVGFIQKNNPEAITIILDSVPLNWGDGVLALYPIDNYD